VPEAALIGSVSEETLRMRLTPAQVGMTLLLGGFVSGLSNGNLEADIRLGREWLTKLPGEPDFGYDAIRWHEYLWASNSGGYKWQRRSADKWARLVRESISRPEWVQAVQELEAEEQSQA